MKRKRDEHTEPQFPKLPEGLFWRVEAGPDRPGTTLLTIRRKTRFGSYVIMRSNTYWDVGITVFILERIAADMYASYNNANTAARLHGDYR